MKTTIDRNLTTLAKAAKVKNDLKELKSMYTDGDLLRAFLDALEADDEHRETMKDYAKTSTINSADIICCDVEGFPAGSFYTENGEEPTHFSVEIKIFGFISAFKIRFYTDLSLNVRLWSFCFGKEHKMYELERYTLDRQ
jgi:hypothetical protein